MKRHSPLHRASNPTGQQRLSITTPLLLNNPTTGPKAHSQHEEIHKEKPKNSNPRKRQHSPHSSTHPPAAAPPPIKTKRLPPSHSHSRSRTPPAFYDNLSHIWLTKHALRELDRRTKENSSLSTQQSAPTFLRKRSSTCLNDDIKRFATHGGPDLSDLRGVCILESVCHS